MKRSIRKVPRKSSKSASDARKNDNRSPKSMEGHAGTTWPHERSSRRHSDKDSIGQPSWPMPSRSFVPVKAIGTMPANSYASSSPTDHPCHRAICGLGVGLGQALQESVSGCTHLIVAVNKFTKWIEARYIANITSSEAAIFFHDVVYRFGVPNSIIVTPQVFVLCFTTDVDLSMGYE